jgi:hypothetical protein
VVIVVKLNVCEFRDQRLNELPTRWIFNSLVWVWPAFAAEATLAGEIINDTYSEECTEIADTFRVPCIYFSGGGGSRSSSSTNSNGDSGSTIVGLIVILAV